MGAHARAALVNVPAVPLRRGLAGVTLPRPSWPVTGAVAVTLLAAALRLSSLGRAGSNTYYDAAVHSMGLSLHNFFYAAFDPAGRIAIDKPPIDLWLQVISVKLLGERPIALILPQALAATLAVPLLFDTVRRVAGNAAGLIAAVALAVMPVSVETARSDTMDSVMVALCVLAAWFAVRAAQTGRARWLYLAAIAMGTSFEVKLLEGLLALPAIAAIYLIAAPHPWLRRIVHLALAGGAFLLAALWWPVAVSIASPSQPPFAIGSTDGSVWSAIFYFNGTERLSPHGLRPGQFLGGDAPGPLRLFGLHGAGFGQNLGIELAAALAFGLAGLVLWVWSRRRPTPLALGGAVAAVLWAAACFVVFSKMRSALHLRYLEAMTPPVAALIGAGIAACARACAQRRHLLPPLLTAAAAGATVAYAAGAAPEHSAVLGVATGAAIAAAAVALAWAIASPWLRPRVLPVFVAAAVALACSVASLAVPAQRSQQLVALHATDAGSPGSREVRLAGRSHRYLATQTRHTRFEVAVSNYLTAAALIVQRGRPLVLNSVNRRQIVKVPELRRLVRHHEVRYALIGGRCGTAALNRLAGCPRIERWIRAHAVDVSRRGGFRARGILFRFTGA